MTHIKINKPLFAALMASIVFICSLSIHQSIASNITMGGSTVDNNQIAFKDASSYSDEVEFNSAPEYSRKTVEYKVKYKEIFVKKLENRLEKISTEKLELLSEKLEKIIEKTKESNTMKLESKEKKLAQLLALLEMINETLDEKLEFSVDIDLEELLKI